jgi:hypothetical protein
MTFILPPNPDPWHFVDEFPNECIVEISRKGNLEPCNEIAYAVVYDPDEESCWPVCIYHARGQKLIRLTDILAH